MCWTIQGSIPVWNKKAFSKIPHLPWGSPTSLPIQRSFSRSKMIGGVKFATHVHLMARLEWVELYWCSPYTPYHRKGLLLLLSRDTCRDVTRTRNSVDHILCYSIQADAVRRFRLLCEVLLTILSLQRAVQNRNGWQTNTFKEQQFICKLSANETQYLGTQYLRTVCKQR